MAEFDFSPFEKKLKGLVDDALAQVQTALDEWQAKQSEDTTEGSEIVTFVPGDVVRYKHQPTDDDYPFLITENGYVEGEDHFHITSPYEFTSQEYTFVQHLGA